MIDHEEADRILEDRGHVLLVDGADAGPVQRIYLDDYTGWPSFCTVESAGHRETFVALHEAQVVPGGIKVPYPQTKLAEAPLVHEDRDLSMAEEDALFAYYGVPVDGVVPVVDHLGQVLVVTPHGEVEPRPVLHPDD